MNKLQATIRGGMRPARRLLATTLATLVFWTPVAATVARAQDAEGEAPAPRYGEQIQQEAVESGLALEPGFQASEVLGDALAEESKLDPEAAASVEGESEEPETKPEAGPVTPLALPSGPAKSAVTPQQISLPKGEGSIEGMGESFTPNLSSGTGTFAVPIALPAGRNGVNPSLSLSYSTSGGSGIVGVGWGLAAPFISRQTDKGLPRYRDGAEWSELEDRFMYNGGQELVPVENGDMPDGAAPIPAELSGFQQYRARVEGAFMRFFRSPDLSRWVVQSKDGTRFDFGRLPSGSGANLGDSSVQADPENSRRIFAWYLTRMSDVHGATVQYVYKQDQGQVYLTDLFYDSPASCASATVVARRNCAASMEQYGRHVRLVYEDREDVTESYSTTWRIATHQRLKRVEITSAMGAVGSRALVRRYHLTYAPGSFHSLLTSVRVEGRKSRYGATLGVYLADMISESSLGNDIVGDLLPAMRFGYTEPNATSERIPGFGGIDTTLRTSAESPDHSVDEERSDLFDVNADGLPDLLVTDPARYDSGAGVYFNGFSASGRPFQAGAFSEGVRVGIPQGLSGTMTLSSLNIVPMDIDGDGKSDLLHMPRQQNYGYFVTSKAEVTSRYNPVQGWSFAYIKTALPAGVTDPRIDLGKDTDYLKTLDVNNDHLIDVIKSSGQHIQTWLNLGWLPGGDGRFGSYTQDGGLSTDPVESCLPFAGRNLDLSDPGARIADMNGDGLQDIVQLSFGSVVYFPGRGEGAWGVGAQDCDNSNRRSRHVTMQDPPLELSTELAGVQMVDVNADGATDLVQLSADTMSVWFNRAGMGWTDRIVVDGLPFATETPARTRIADIDGTGTTDIIYARAGKWQWLDPMGGQRPRLLQTVDNGLGALTTLSYSTSVEDYLRDLAGSEFDWNSEPLAPGSDTAKCDAKALRRGAGCVHRGGGSPVVSTVVRAVTTTDRMSALGVADSITRTEYRYHDAYYEGIEQEFRGFGAAEAVAIGDAHGPTSITRTYFHQGKRPNEIAADRLADNPNEALKGREYLTESYDLNGNYLSTSHATYAVRSLGTGLDGTDITYAYVKRSDELKYDTAAASVSSSGSLTFETVLRERAGANVSAVLAAPAQEGDATHTVTVRNARYARIATTIDLVDNVGNMLQQTALGRVDQNEAITSYSTPVRVNDAGCDNSGWLWRTSESWVGGDGGQRFKRSQSTFSACGDGLTSTGFAELPAEGAFNFAGSGGTASYTQTAQTLVSSTRYDVWGQATESCGGALIDAEPITNCQRYAKVDRDPAYQQFVVQESTATALNGAGFTLLSTTADWDEGLGTLVRAVDPNNLVSEVFYDGLGRTTGMIAPNVQGCEGKRVPTTRIFYDLTTSPASRPLSRVHTITELDCSAFGTDMLEAYAYIDGLGRPRAALSEGDPDPLAWGDNRGHAWVRSGLTVFNAKGQPAIAYQPGFYELSPGQYDSVLRNPQQAYTEAFADAFGRPVLQRAEDGSLSRMTYSALSVEAWDAVDNDISHRHYGTSTLSFQDGHGREIGQRLHQRHAVGGSDEFHFLFSYYRPDGAVTRVIRARAPKETLRPDSGHAALTNWVERSFVYDTAGRRIASFDPDTDNRAAAVHSKTWRYLFNSVGDLAAVRDPRGCGQNFFYDRAGRLVGEQYVSCDEAQANVESLAGTVPAGSIGLGITTAQDVHALYHFDTYPGWIGSALPSVRSGVLGRATGVTDRGQRSVVAYDDRGNALWGARQMALPAEPGSYTPTGAQAGHAPVYVEGAEVARPNAFDTLHTYVRTASFDHAGRGLTAVLPTDPDFTSGTAPVVGGTMQYNAAGKPKRANLRVDAATYPVVQNLRYERDGLVRETTYGDGANSGRASTVSLTEYDVRRRPVSLSTLRMPKADAAPQTLSAVSVLVDQRLRWDRASNLTDILDERFGNEWPESHRPQSTSILHDALYRVERASFTYTDDNNGLALSDTASDWRDTEADHRLSDPMRSKAAPRLGALPSTRVITLEYRLDWLANMVSWDDDARSFYERSIGSIVNGNNLSPNAVAPSYRPSALYLASNLRSTPATDKGGYLDLDYGVGGNVVSMTVHAQCVDKAPDVCADPGGNDPVARRNAMRSNCACASEQHYSYRYDELNRMSEARRFDRESGLWSLKARQRYRYDSANQRTVKETSDIDSNDTRATLYVLPGDFERRGLAVLGDSYAAIGGASAPDAAQSPPQAGLYHWYRADNCPLVAGLGRTCIDRMGRGNLTNGWQEQHPTVDPQGLGGQPALVFGDNSVGLGAGAEPAPVTAEFVIAFAGVVDPSSSSVVDGLTGYDTYKPNGRRDRNQLLFDRRSSPPQLSWSSNANYGSYDTAPTESLSAQIAASVQVGQPFIAVVRGTRTATELYLNGKLVGTTRPSEPGILSTGIGGPGAKRVGELLMYQRALGTSTELPSLHRYLGNRYGITMRGLSAGEVTTPPVPCDAPNLLSAGAGCFDQGTSALSEYFHQPSDPVAADQALQIEPEVADTPVGSGAAARVRFIAPLPTGYYSHTGGVLVPLTQALEVGEVVVEFDAKHVAGANQLHVGRAFGGASGDNVVTLSPQWAHYRIVMQFGYSAAHLVMNLVPWVIPSAIQTLEPGEFLIDNLVVRQGDGSGSGGTGVVGGPGGAGSGGVGSPDDAGKTETHYNVAGARVVWKNRDTLTPGQLDPDHRITFAVGDLIQSTSAVVDLMSGELLEVTGFYPNGAREHWLDSSLDNADAVPLETVGFTGKEADEEVGLTYFGERYLVSRIGRWATPDPLAVHAMGGGEAGNSYHYVSGNLLAGRDPLGLCPEGQSCPDANLSQADGTVENSNANLSTPDGGAVEGEPVEAPLESSMRGREAKALRTSRLGEVRYGKLSDGQWYPRAPDGKFVDTMPAGTAESAQLNHGEGVETVAGKDMVGRTKSWATHPQLTIAFSVGAEGGAVAGKEIGRGMYVAVGAEETGVGFYSYDNTTFSSEVAGGRQGGVAVSLDPPSTALSGGSVGGQVMGSTGVVAFEAGYSTAIDSVTNQPVGYGTFSMSVDFGVQATPAIGGEVGISEGTHVPIVSIQPSVAKE